jgi:hypothetical protein
MSFYTRRMLRTASMFIPCGLVIFGWPFMAKAMVGIWDGIDTKEYGRTQAALKAKAAGQHA